MLVALRLVHPGGTDQIVLFACLLGLVGITTAMASPCSVSETGQVSTLYGKANKDFFGKTGPSNAFYSLSSATYNLGLTVGPELAAVLKQRIGYGDMNLVLAGISLFGAGFCYAFMGGKPRWLQRRLGEVAA